MENLTDEELMGLVKDGNLDMMSHLFNRYSIGIYNFSLQMTRDKEVSKDVTQDTFYKVLKYRATYKNTKFSSWIYTIARNLCHDYYKILKKREQQIIDLQSSVKLVEDNIESNENIKLLNQALDKLNTSDRELIIMSRYQGMKYHEIAKITDSTLGAVKTKIHRALHKLKCNYFTKSKQHGL